jgi:hypothetical protein
MTRSRAWTSPQIPSPNSLIHASVRPFKPVVAIIMLECQSPHIMDDNEHLLLAFAERNSHRDGAMFTSTDWLTSLRTIHNEAPLEVNARVVMV